MCGKRLKAWKTMPIPRRTVLTSTPRAVISLPFTKMRPLSTGSRRFTHAQQRRLPRAGGADEADDVVLRDFEVDASQHLDLAEGLVDVFEAESAHIAVAPA